MSGKNRDGWLAPALVLGAVVVLAGAAGCGKGGQLPLGDGGGTDASGTGGGGPGGSGPGGAGGGSGGRGGCASNADCRGSAGNPVCSVPTGECVGCLMPNDCGTGRDCVANRCSTPVACVNSLDCTLRQVCDRATMRCVECVGDADCGAAMGCAGNRCRKRCVSDNECTPLGLLCDKGLGFCASCVAHTDCPANSWCNQGECALDECTAGATRCQTGGLSTCDAVGSRWGEPAPCPSGRSCFELGGSAMCRDWACQPSTLACAPTGERVVSCSADGLVASAVADCGAAGQVCVAAACWPVVCVAGARFCDASQVRTCSQKGDSSTVYATCGAGQFCDRANPACRAQLCAPNQPACDGAFATTCNAEGSGYMGARTDCASGGQVCYQGGCTSLVCAPNAYFCEAGAVRRCAADGLGSTLYQTCSTTQYCDATGATCRARVCTAGQPACDGSVATTCNADGSGYTGGRNDCTPSGLFCSAGTCVPETPSVDVIGLLASSLATTSKAKLNFFAVTRSRTLRLIEQYMALSAASTPIVFLVFESATQTGTYAPIFNSVVSLPPGTGYQPSGTINVPLVAGRYYAIGVQWGATTATYYWEQVTPSQTTSFGALGNATTITTTTPPISVAWPATIATYRYNQRLTTGP